MKIKDLINKIETLAPPELQESYDNSGLQIGNADLECTGALISLDITEDVLDEAIEMNCNLIIAHHPLLFKGLKRISPDSWINRCVIKAIRHDLNIYAVHTNLDNVYEGVNQMLAKRIGLKNIQILAPVKGSFSKLVCFIPIAEGERPEAHLEEVKNAVFKAGAGKIGEYDCCSFSMKGIGTFRAGDRTNPFVGEKGTIHHQAEYRFEVIMPSYLNNRIVKALIQAHPYEEVAYDLFSLSNETNQIGAGMIGELERSENSEDFLKRIKNLFNCRVIRHTQVIKDEIKKVAVCGGSGSFLLEDAIKQQADIYISGDFKYHQFFDADKRIMIADIGHYESEQFTIDLLADYLHENFTNFAVQKSVIDTNPIKFL